MKQNHCKELSVCGEKVFFAKAHRVDKILSILQETLQSAIADFH
jgi:hypothetical protein